MKIVIINGSPRKNGATGKILMEMYDNLCKNPNTSVELIHLCNLNMKFCTGCSSCFSSGTCYINDDLEILSEKIRNANGIILGSPTYASNISSQLKLLIDRGHFVLEQLLHNKFSISVVTYENYGGRDALKIINKLLSYSGSEISSKILLRLPFGKNPLEDRKFKKSLNKKTEKFYKDLYLNRFSLFNKLKHYIIFNIGIKPFVKSKGETYKGVTAYWLKNRL
ncbi:MAG: flavodoxin family protein [Clostridium sp.]